MRGGFSLIEVLLSLAVLGSVMVLVTRMQMDTGGLGAYADMHTRASVIGQARLSHLCSLDVSSEQLSTSWHEDMENPYTVQGRLFYCFWRTEPFCDGSRVIVYVAWGSPVISLDAIEGSDLPKVSLSAVVPHA